MNGFSPVQEKKPGGTNSRHAVCKRFQYFCSSISDIWANKAELMEQKNQRRTNRAGDAELEN